MFRWTSVIAGATAFLVTHAVLIATWSMVRA